MRCSLLFWIRIQLKTWYKALVSCLGPGCIILVHPTIDGCGEAGRAGVDDLSREVEAERQSEERIGEAAETVIIIEPNV